MSVLHSHREKLMYLFTERKKKIDLDPQCDTDSRKNIFPCELLTNYCVWKTYKGHELGSQVHPKFQNERHTSSCPVPFLDSWQLKSRKCKI